MNDKKVLIASDHAGFVLKTELQKNLQEWVWSDLGPFEEISVDYPDYAKQLGLRLLSENFKQGILVCGSGIGMSIAANKISGIRAAMVETVTAARFSREHNDANVLCLGARLISLEYAIEITRLWLTTAFSQNARHVTRIQKIHLLEH